MSEVGLYVSVPVACFRVPRAREYFETYPCPPPATVYGMLLSMVGEVNRRVHEGTELAIAVLSDPQYSVVVRTLWRVKSQDDGLGQGGNRRPDYQELLTDVRLAVWLRRGEYEGSEIPLVQRVQDALDTPSSVSRFGGLSLGESSHLVDEISRLGPELTHGQLLLADEGGGVSLPIWPDHVGSATHWGQYSLRDYDWSGKLPHEAWTTIRRTS